MSSLPLLLLLSASLLLLPVASAGFGKYAAVDLTHAQDKNARGWPTFRQFNHTNIFRGPWGVEGQWMQAFDFVQSEHVGTHMDAPSHFVEGGKNIDELPLEDLAGPGIVLDVREKSQNGDLNYAVSVSDVTEWESEHGRIPEGAVVLLYTGKSAFYADAKKYYGWQTEQDFRARNLNNMHWPGFSGDASAWLIRERGVAGFGLDAISLDPARTDKPHDLVAHRNVLGAGKFIIENVGARISELPARGFFVLAMPYKIGGGSGAPVRLVALIDEDGELTEQFSEISPASTATLSFASAIVAMLAIAINA